MFWKGFQYHYNTAIIIINLYQITYVSTFISFTVSSFFSLPLCNLIKEGKYKSTRFNIIGKRHSGRYQTKLMTLTNVMGHVQSSATTTAAWLEMTVGMALVRMNPPNLYFKGEWWLTGSLRSMNWRYEVRSVKSPLYITVSIMIRLSGLCNVPVTFQRLGKNFPHRSYVSSVPNG